MNIDNTVLNCLPEQIKSKLMEYNTMNEIRIIENCPLCITIGNKNLVTDHIVTKDEIDYCVTKFCKNSVHTYFDSIKKGYIPFDNGYRIGVCGNAVTEQTEIKNISHIRSLNIRIPSEDFYIPPKLLQSISDKKGLLIFSPVNTGKTTFLKAVIAHLSSPPYNKRISVIDCKKELYSEKIHKNCPVDFFIGYPKYEAISIAIQNMSPEIIICDEIGIQDDISPLIECKNCGVSLFCSAHASCIEELTSRESIKKLVNSGIFEGFIGISMKSGERVFEYKSGEEIMR